MYDSKKSLSRNSHDLLSAPAFAGTQRRTRRPAPKPELAPVKLVPPGNERAWPTTGEEGGHQGRRSKHIGDKDTQGLQGQLVAKEMVKLQRLLGAEARVAPTPYKEHEIYSFDANSLWYTLTVVLLQRATVSPHDGREQLTPHPAGDEIPLRPGGRRRFDIAELSEELLIKRDVEQP